MIKLASALVAASLLAAPVHAADVGAEMLSVTCYDAYQGNPSVPTAFAEGYILGLMFNSDPNPMTSSHVDELHDFCREHPTMKLAALIATLKIKYAAARH